MLELKHISKTFFPGTVNAKTALDDLSLTLHDGDFVTVIGGNGAGKSTMLNATAGTLQVDSGEVFLDGIDVTDLPEVKSGDEVEIFGKNVLCAEDAAACGTIPYELLCAVSKRVPRHYFLHGKRVDTDLTPL